jgi:hypothetical protein
MTLKAERLEMTRLEVGYLLEDALSFASILAKPIASYF